MASPPSRFIVVLTTVGDAPSARRLARLLLAERAAACVQIGAAHTSLYRWRGRLQTARERQLWIKTRRRDYRRVERILRANHPYEVPEIIALPVVAGARDYLRWLGESGD